MSTPVPLACRCDFPATCAAIGECHKLRAAGIIGVVPMTAPATAIQAIRSEPILNAAPAAPVDPTGKQGRGGPR